jgi:DNA-directed RNA polymerase subunit M/transcription elongation factor TFIIS
MENPCRNRVAMNFCPKCENYLYLEQGSQEVDLPTGKKQKQYFLNRRCRTCGYVEVDHQGGLVNETIVQERASEGYKILLNEFTRQDPTLPHVTTLPCPNTKGNPEKGLPICQTYTEGRPRDVIIIKYDAQNMKFLYICNVCGEQWRSRS